MVGTLLKYLIGAVAHQQSDELEYLVDGLISGGAAARRASALRLVDACASTHARFLLRLSGCLPRLLSALAVAQELLPGGRFESVLT
jgi:hypothetical protein